MRQSDRKGVEGLAGQLQALSPGARPTALGLLAELHRRPGREVEAWVAIPDFSRNADVVGLATLVTSVGEAGVRRSIAWLLVQPSERRQGVGRALVETICSEVAKRDQPAIWIECHTKWPIVMAFWRSMGFRERESLEASPGS